MSNVVAFPTRSNLVFNSPQGAPKILVCFAYPDATGDYTRQFDTIDDALLAMREELLDGRGFAATVRHALPPDEAKPEHAQ